MGGYRWVGLIGLVAASCNPQDIASFGQGTEGLATYYDTVDATNQASLRASLHDTIDDHTRFPFTSTALDTWDILDAADEDPNNSSNILDVYLNASYPKAGAGNSNYNREHTWPSSFGFPNDGASNYPYSDTHALFLSDSGYNSARNNKPYFTCNPTCTENPTLLNNGQGGGSGAYPGNSNWREGAGASGTWETWIGRRGDVARAVMYLDIRYEGGTHGPSGASEPDLILTDTESLIASSNTGANESVAYMGFLSILRQWHIEDPVDALELARNEVVFSHQGNRNPFIDHPEWVACLFDAVCGDVTAPAAPSVLIASGGNARVDLDWADNSDPDLIGYFVHRSTTPGGPYARLNVSMATSSAYSDGSALNGVTYYYVVTAVDVAGNVSADSAEASATPSGGAGSTVWINELHYDNTGSDTGEFVEVAGAAGTDLTGWSVVGYNGSNGSTYKTVSLSGVIPDQGGCLGTVAVAFSSMQNGSPDGLALVDAGGVVVEFISYEGTLVATSGPANGMTSTDIGVSEPTSTPVGFSLQLAGAGAVSSDFTWQSAAANTQGAVNAGQTFDACSGGCTSDPECDDGLFCNGNETCNAGACQAGTPPSVDDGVACTIDACDEATDTVAHTPDDAFCDDGLFCNGNETCDAVLDCQAGTAPSVDDGVACTIDACDEATDTVAHTPDDAFCDDGLFCNGNETCDAVLDCQAGGDPCVGQSCDEAADICFGCAVDADCDDGLFCNGNETCNAGTCGAGTPPNVDDGVGCTADSCDEATDSIVHTPEDVVCDNGAFCDGAETCDPVLDCQPGSAIDCSGLDDQCNAGACDEAGDQCVANPLPAGTTCDDQDACTAPDQCDGAGSCGGANVCGGGPSLQTVSLTSGAGWNPVGLAVSYTSMVVACTPSYSSAQVAAVVRVRNAVGSSFELSVVAADGSGATLAGVAVHCFIVEEGVYTAAQDGVTMEAVRYDSTVTDRAGSWNAQSQTVSNTYSNPVVIGQVMSANDAAWSTFWSRGGNAKSAPSGSDIRTGKHVGEDPNRTRATEIVGYIVIEAGSGTIGTRAYTAGLGADSVRGVDNNPPNNYGISGLASASAAVVSQAAMDGGNGGWAVLYGASPISATSLSLAIDEDQAKDSERKHTTEQVAYIVFE